MFSALPNIRNRNARSIKTVNSVDSALVETVRVDRVPQRLVDFFCVIGGAAPQEDRSQTLVPTMLDCYPRSRADMEFPRHISKFCCPSESYRGAEKAKPVILWTTALTMANGNRLYGTVLTFYENRTDIVEKNLYYPKCLVVLSHHAQFAAFRQFLIELFRIFKSNQSPLPLESFIANFCDEISLPPAGKEIICWRGFTKLKHIEIARAPPNQLPTLNFSLKPLFGVLSVANLLVVWGILMQEGRVVLLSEHVGLLTPVAEALQSLLFPLQWQGMYIPVLPFDMVDILDAPVPFIIGLHSRYWKEQSNFRPASVTFVDLDKDLVHLGWEDEERQQPVAHLPDLPSREIMDLKIILEELTDHLYMLPANGLKGCIMTADGQVFGNSERQPYSQMTCLQYVRDQDLEKVENHRKYILKTAERVMLDSYPPLQKSDFILDIDERRLSKDLSERSLKSHTTGHTSMVSSIKRATRVWQAHRDRIFAYTGVQYATPNPFYSSSSSRTLKRRRKQLAKELYEVDIPHAITNGNTESQAINTNTDQEILTMAIRKAFLHFFVKVFSRYKQFLEVGTGDAISMRKDAFINSLRDISARSKAYMTTVVDTQMFERFIHDRSRRKVFFDEQIIVTLNQNVSSKQRQPTPFLDDKRWKVNEIVHPKAPTTWSVSEKIFAYKEFPKLDEDELERATGYEHNFFRNVYDGVFCPTCIAGPLC